MSIEQTAEILALRSRAERAEKELHDWRNGRQLGAFQEDLNAERSRRFDAEAALEQAQRELVELNLVIRSLGTEKERAEQERQAYRDTLIDVAHHGGEPVTLLKELDALREENKRLREALERLER